MRRVRQIEGWQNERGRQPAAGLSRQNISQAWNLSPTSSAFAQTLAALHQYGLLEFCGGEGDRLFQLSALTRNLVPTDEVRPSDRAWALEHDALHEAALRPKIFSELWDVARARGFERSVLTKHLTVDRGIPFTSKAADNVSRVFNETVKYAGLVFSDQEIPDRESAMEVDICAPWAPPSGDGEWDVKVAASEEDWTVEALPGEASQITLLRYRGKPSRKRYERIRDVLDLKIRWLNESDFAASVSPAARTESVAGLEDDFEHS